MVDEMTDGDQNVLVAQPLMCFFLSVLPQKQDR